METGTEQIPEAHGALAQLVEHIVHIDGVTGSSPVSTTTILNLRIEDFFILPQGGISMRKIIRNAIRCNHCGDVIESTYRHSYVQCSCGKVAVDGGTDYLRRSYSGNRDDYTDLSEYAEVEEKQDN